MGFDKPYDAAEAFMRAIVAYDDPVSAIELDLEGLRLDARELAVQDFIGGNVWNRTSAFERIYNKCIEQNFFFDAFLDLCAKSKLFDGWFLSEDFMDNVYVGSIRAQWTIKMADEKSKEPYRSRFRKLIADLDVRLNWTSKYLEPNSFWGIRKVYW